MEGNYYLPSLGFSSLIYIFYPDATLSHVQGTSQVNMQFIYIMADLCDKVMNFGVGVHPLQEPLIFTPTPTSTPMRTLSPKPKYRAGEKVERLVSPVKPKRRGPPQTQDDVSSASASRAVEDLSSANSEEDFFLRFVALRKSFSKGLTSEIKTQIWKELCALDGDKDFPSIDYLRKRVISEKDTKVCPLAIYRFGELRFCPELKDTILKTCKVVLAFLDSNPHLRSKGLAIVKGMVEWVKVLT
jgi:hypothetical protein